jgi:hypothetical protein
METEKIVFDKKIYIAIRNNHLEEFPESYQKVIEEDQPCQELYDIIRDYCHDTTRFCLKEERILDLPWEDRFEEMKEEISEKLAIAPLFRQVDILSKEREYLLSKVLFEKFTCEPTLSTSYYHIMDGENPSVYDVVESVNMSKGKTEFREIEVEGTKYYYLGYGGYIGDIIEGVGLAYLIPYIDERIIELGGSISQRKLTEYSWENKSELCELIYAITKSKRILKNGKSLSESAVMKLFGTMFNVDLEGYYRLLSAYMTSNKITKDEKYFTDELSDHARNWKPKGK